jgi:lipid-A-disaccharide synthase
MTHVDFEAPVFFCAGEPSGDLYAGLLIRHLKERFPMIDIYGVGDGCMQASGADVVFQNERLMVFGLLDGLRSIIGSYTSYQKIARSIYRLKPRTFVAVAYPGMNLLLCRYARKLGIRVYYYLPPQIWAWGLFRKFFIKKWVHAVISVFPFEAEFYRGLGFETEQIRNPLVNELSQYKRNDHKKRIGFMPGSRPSQIDRNMPVITELINLLAVQLKGIEFCLIVHGPGHARDLAERVQGRACIIGEQRHQMMKNCDLLVTSSGTATLEAALLEVPQVFFNRPSFVDFHILRRFLKINEYNLANIYFGQKAVPCYVDCSRKGLVHSVYDSIIEHMRSTKNKPRGTQMSQISMKEVQ